VTTARTGGRRALLVAAGLAAGPLAGVGLARFGYSLLLPPMRADLGWSYTEAGALNAANALGYLLGALAAAAAVRRAGAPRALLAGLVTTAAALLAGAASGDLAVLLGLRLLAGAAGAVAFVAAVGLVARLGATRPAGSAAVLIGTCVAGGGLGMVLSGLALPPLLAALAPGTGWRAGWLVLGGLAALAVLPALLAGRAVPAAPAPAPPPDPGARPAVPVSLGPAAVAYALFGAGYIGYLTFVVAGLAEARVGAAGVLAFWTALGLTAAVAALALSARLGRARGGRGLAALLAVLAVGTALPALVPGPQAAGVSAVLVGATFLSTATAVTTVARSVRAPERWDAAIAGLTVAFAVGQCAGPLLAGAVSDRAGVGAALLVSAVLLVLGALAALAQRARAPTVGV
jgi:predicted MFS family arabinose efflux permease